MEPSGAEPLRHHQGPPGPQEEGRGGFVHEQPVGGPALPHLADGGGGRGAAAGPQLAAAPAAPASSLPVSLCLLLVRRWWQRGLGRRPLARCRPAAEPHRQR